MYRYIITLLLLTIILTNSALSQEIIIGGESSAGGFMNRNPLLKTTINTQEKELLSYVETNVKINPMSFQSNLYISNDGNVIKADRIILKLENGNKFYTIKPQFLQMNNPRQYFLSQNGNWIIRTSYDSEKQNNVLEMYSIINNNLEYVYEGVQEWFDLNKNASVFVYIPNELNRHYFKIIQRMDGVFSENLIDTELRYIKGFRLSSLGNRVFFVADRINEDYKQYYIENNQNEWSKPIEIVIKDNNTNLLNFSIVDMANNGKTLLVYDFESKKHAIVNQDKNGNWSTPNYINYKQQHEKGFWGDTFHLSQDGKVLAIKSLTRDIDGVWSFYDAFIYFLNSDGSWTKYKVNDPNQDVVGDILLSGDGTTLYWIGQESMSVPYMNY